MAIHQEFRASRPIDEMDTRRHGDSIEDMIAKENDPKQRSFLIVLNSINNALLANTATVRDIKESLDVHLEQYAKDTRADADLKNQGRGAWRVLAWVLGIVQVIGLGIWVNTQQDIKDIRAAITAGQKADATIESRLAAIEAVTRTNTP